MKWINVNEELPKEMDLKIILYSKKYGAFQGYLSQFKEFWASVRYMGSVKYPLKDITHWMPLPPKPKPTTPRKNIGIKKQN